MNIRDVIQQVVGQYSSYYISQKTGLSTNIILGLRDGSRKLDNVQLSTIEKLQDFYKGEKMKYQLANFKGWDDVLDNWDTNPNALRIYADVADREVFCNSFASLNEWLVFHDDNIIEIANADGGAFFGSRLEYKSLDDFLFEQVGEDMVKEILYAAINAEYRNWLEDTIQADLKYSLDPAQGVVVEDLNAYMDLDLDWGAWNAFYEKNADYIKELESAL